MTISVVLVGAEVKQHNNEVKLWLKRLKDVMFDADDLLDDMFTEALQREVMTQDKKAKEVCVFFFPNLTNFYMVLKWVLRLRR